MRRSSAVACTAYDVEKIINKALSNSAANNSHTNNSNSNTTTTFGLGPSSSKAPPQYFWESDGKFHPCPDVFFAETTSYEMIKLWDLWWQDQVNVVVGGLQYMLPHRKMSARVGGLSGAE